MILALIAAFSCGQIWAEDACIYQEPDQATQEITPCPPDCEVFTYPQPTCVGKLEFTSLFWHISNAPQGIPLVTVGPVVPNLAPVLNTPGTKVVLGGKDIEGSWHAGARYTLSIQDNSANMESEVSYFYLHKRTRSKIISSDGSPNSAFLAIPFINALTDEESSTRLALPGRFAGKADLTLKNQMEGAEFNIMPRLDWDFCNSFDVRGIVGFRYWNFKENLYFSTHSPSVIPPKDTFVTKDRFKADNNFYGGQFGLEAEFFCGEYISIQARAKLALGCMCEKGKIKGSLLTNDFFTGIADPALFPAGYFALPTNEGSFNRYEFAVIPEGSVDLFIPLMSHLQLRLGYTFLYANKVLRPGKEMDRVINPTQAPAIINEPITSVAGKLKPKPQNKQSSVWVHGVNIGVELVF